jgi:hypothetical protein
VWLLSFFVSLAARFLSCSDSLVAVAGARVYRTGRTTKLAEQKQELNIALLKVIEKDGAVERLSEQLQSECRTLALSYPFCGPAITCRSIRLLEIKTELEQSQMAWEQDAAAWNQARDTQRQSEAARQKTIEDLAKLGRAISTTMAGLSVSLGPVTPETLV